MGNVYLGRGKGVGKSMEPVRLYKSVNLKRDRITDEIRLLSVAFSDDSKGFSVNEQAQCLLFGERGVNNGLLQTLHGDSPARACRCGFHAYKEVSKALQHTQLNTTGEQGHFVAGVIASGKMFEYNEGYRYGHQRVEAIIVTKCGSGHCLEYADRVGYQGDKVFPLCSLHSCLVPKYSLRSFNELGELANASLPVAAPRIHVRSHFKHIEPWVSPREATAWRTAKRVSSSKSGTITPASIWNFILDSEIIGGIVLFALLALLMFLFGVLLFNPPS